MLPGNWAILCAVALLFLACSVQPERLPVTISKWEHLSPHLFCVKGIYKVSFFLFSFTHWISWTCELIWRPRGNSRMGKLFLPLLLGVLSDRSQTQGYDHHIEAHSCFYRLEPDRLVFVAMFCHPSAAGLKQQALSQTPPAPQPLLARQG